MKPLIIFIISIFLYSCANVVPLSGGKKDEKPPILLQSNLDSINFKSKNIVLRFDEYIQLNQPEKNISIQPNHTTIKTQLNKKKLTITFDSSLHPNTTYVLNIQNGIKDNNEGNNYSYTTLFSTGNKIDTGKIYVRINNFNNYDNLKIALLNNAVNDSFKLFKPLYIYPLYNENYVFNGLTNSAYHLWTFTDKNNDNIPDYYSPINFIKEIILDSIYKINLLDWNPPFKISKCVNYQNDYYKIYYASPYQIDSLIKDATYITKDSALFTKDKFSFINFKPIENEPAKDFKNEIYKIKSNGIRVIKTEKNYLIQYKDYSQTLNEYKNKLISLKDTIFTIDTDTFWLNKLSIENENKLAHIYIKLNNKYDIKIMKEKEVIKSYSYCNYVDDFIAPGNYTLIIKNNSIDYPLLPFKEILGEQVLLEKPIILKANWEENIDINLE